MAEGKKREKRVMRARCPLKDRSCSKEDCAWWAPWTDYMGEGGCCAIKVMGGALNAMARSQSEVAIKTSSNVSLKTLRKLRKEGRLIITSHKKDE